ncbi:MAG TPA: hypothetical protein VJR89_42125 [Polyangiales bacterium]|nr:hypothetical protein [Polyangiales bacterium]
MVVVAIGLLGACGGDEEELPDVECNGTVPAYEDVAAFDKCSTCHSSEKTGAQRNQAPADINFNTESASRAHAEDAAHEVFEGEMPPAGSGITLTSAEKDALYKWALCE